MSEITVEKPLETGRKSLLFDICSAMKNAGRESASTLIPTLNNQPVTEVNMSLESPTQIAPYTQAEPPQWHVYRALVLYLYDNPEATKDLYFRHKLNAAHDAYLNTFAAG